VDYLAAELSSEDASLGSRFNEQLALGNIEKAAAMLAAGLVWVRTRRLYAQAAAVQDPASTSERPNAVSSPEGQQLILLAHQKLKSVADLQERIEWSCKNSCGFHAAFQQVCAHERTCDLKASASQKPMPHPCQFFGTAVDGVTLADGSQDAQVSSTGNGSGFIPWKEAVATPLRGLTDEKELVYVLCDWTPEENAPNKMRVRRGQRILVSLSTDRGWSYGEILAGGGLIFLWGASTRTADTTISPPFPIQRPRLTPPAMRATGLSPIATTTLEYAFCTLPGLVLSVDGRNAQDYRTHILERWF
jgi:hypothetical protein